MGQHQDECGMLLAATVGSTLNIRAEPNPAWYCSTLGMSTEERLGGDPAKVKLLKWEADSFHELVAEKLMRYERELKELGLLLFPEVLQRVARLDRALASPGGSVLLAGSSGSGRRSLALLLAYMHNLELRTPKMVK